MSDLKFHWLVAGQVVGYDRKGHRGEANFNTLVLTDQAVFTRKNMAQAQEGLMRRFIDVGQAKDVKVHDCFVMSVSSLGLMTVEEFNAGFEKAPEVVQ